MQEKNIIKIIKSLIKADSKVKVALIGAIAAVIVAAIGVPIVIYIKGSSQPPSPSKPSIVSNSDETDVDSSSNNGSSENEPFSTPSSEPETEHTIKLDANGGSTLKNEIFCGYTSSLCTQRLFCGLLLNPKLNDTSFLEGHSSNPFYLGKMSHMDTDIDSNNPK